MRALAVTLLIVAHGLAYGQPVERTLQVPVKVRDGSLHQGHGYLETDRRTFSRRACPR